MSEEAVAPLDAYITAKPDEPVFTLQGGDPLAPPLVRLWAAAARVRTGRLSAKLITDLAEGVADAAERADLSDNEREIDNLLRRATAAEEVSWAMDSYQRGHVEETVPSAAADTHIDEARRIDLHDQRIRAASKLRNLASEVNEMLIELIPDWLAAGGGADVEDLIPEMKELTARLQQVSDVVEPRKMMKRATSPI